MKRGGPVEKVKISELRWLSFGWWSSQRYSPGTHVPKSLVSGERLGRRSINQLMKSLRNQHVKEILGKCTLQGKHSRKIELRK